MTTIKNDEKSRRKPFHRDIERPFQKSVHLDTETALRINRIKDARTAAGESGNTVDDVIYDAIIFFLDSFDKKSSEKSKEKTIHRDVKHQVQKSVHFDKETAFLINRIKDARIAAGESYKPTDRILYDAVLFWMNSCNRDISRMARTERFHLNVNRTVQRSVHFDYETSSFINRVKDARAAAGEPNNTVDGIIYDAVIFWLNSGDVDKYKINY